MTNILRNFQTLKFAPADFPNLLFRQHRTCPVGLHTVLHGNYGHDSVVQLDDQRSQQRPARQPEPEDLLQVLPLLLITNSKRFKPRFRNYGFLGYTTMVVI